MHYQYIPYLWLSALSVAVSITLSLFAWRNRNVRGAIPFFSTMVLVTIWTVAQALELAAIDLPTKIMWANVQYLGIMFAPVTYLVMVIQFTGREHWFTRRWLLLLLVTVPIIVNVLFWTNDVHHLLRQNVFLDTSGPFPVVGKTFGSLFWIFASYNFSITLLALILLIDALRQKASLFREQAVLLFVGLLLPFMTTVEHLAGFLMIRFDLTPVIFSLAGVVISWGIFRYRLFYTVPIARYKVIEGMNTGVIVLDIEGFIVDLNPAAMKLLGCTSVRVVGKSAERLFSDHPELLWLYNAGTTASVELNVDANGTQMYYDVTVNSLEDYNRRPLGQIMLAHNITERKQAEDALRSSEERFKITLLSVGDGVISTDKYGHVELLNKVAEHLTGWSQEEAVGKPLGEVFNIINEYTRERCDDPVQKVLETGKPIELANHTILVSKDSREIPIEDSAAPIKDEDDKIEGVVLVFRDFTEKREKQRKIEHLSYHDQLTGLYNRRFFEEELNRLDIVRNLPITLVMADLNGLKLTNDAFGHIVGDKLLKKAAELIMKECRADDIVARIGGDEFILLLSKTDTKEAEKIVQRINQTVSNETVDSIVLSVSFGWETKHKPEEKMSTVLKKAEDNMYRRKLFESSSMRIKTIELIINTLYEKDKSEEQHSQRVSELCAAIGYALHLNVEDVSELRTLGLMHDIGMIALDEKIINMPGELNDSEWLEIKRHSETGYRILSSVNETSQLAEYVLAHHERWDGKGYPKGLKGEEIPLQARIIAVADAYDAMTSDRPYRKALTEETTINEIKCNAGLQFDPLIARVLLENITAKSGIETSSKI